MGIIQKILFIFVVSFLAVTAWAQVTPQGQQQSQNVDKINDCDFMRSNIKHFCSQNTILQNNLQNRLALEAILATLQGSENNQSSGNDAANQGRRIAKDTENSVEDLKIVCRKAQEKCTQVCKVKFDQATARNDRGGAQQAQQTAQLCREDAEQAIQQAEATGNEMAQILGQLLAALAQMMGQSNDQATQQASLETDELAEGCEGETAHLRIDCMEKTEPRGTRASLGGARVGGLGNPLNGDLNIAAQDDDSDNGSRRNDSGTNNGFGAAGFGAAGGGLGGFGSNNGGSGGSNGAAADEGLNANIGKGYFGGGGGGGGGGGFSGSSSGSKGGSGQFGSYKLDNGGKAIKSASLGKGKNKAKGPGRSPASENTANGPFDYNWEVVTKAYKKTSSSLFHAPE